jgi:hypothetical protein
MTKRSKAAEPERQQWVIDPHHPTGFRLVDLPAPSPQPAAFFDGEIFERKDRQDRLRRRLADKQPERSQWHESIFVGNDRVIRKDGKIVILVGRVEGRRNVQPFELGDVHTAYEWAVVLVDHHPHHPLWYAKGGVGVDDKRRRDLRMAAIEFLGGSEMIFEALVAAYECGRIKHVLAVWHEKPPTDTTLLRFRRDDVLKVISELGAAGVVIGMLMAEWERRDADQKSAPEPTLSKCGPTQRQASETEIHKAIAEVYADAAKNDLKPPNVREIGEPVLARLLKCGLSASGNRIMGLAGDSRYGGIRRKPGTTVASERKRQNTVPQIS